MVFTAITYNALAIRPYYAKDGSLLAVQLYGTAIAAAGAENYIIPISRVAEYQVILGYLQGRTVRVRDITLAPTVNSPTKFAVSVWYSGVTAGVIEGYSETRIMTAGEYGFMPMIDRPRKIDWSLYDPTAGRHFMGIACTALTINDIIGYFIDMEVVE